MAVHAQCLQNVSMATGTFASQLRGSRPRHTSTAAIAGRAQRFSALSTYNRRFEPSAPRQLGGTLTATPPQQQAYQIGSSASAFGSSASAFAGRPTIARLASHIGRPHFNALARLASNALGTVRRSTDDATSPPGVAYASAAVAASPAAAAPVQQVIPGQHSPAATPFAEAAQRVPSRNFDSDLGFPTDFGERYTLTEEIGSGSFGTVYAATDKESGESVAVKVLPKDGAAGRRTRGSGRAGRGIVLGKVKKELDVLQRLQASGNAIELLGTYEDRSCVYIVMEECRGGDLETLLEDHGPLEEADVARIMYEALQTVAACHKHNLYHGDVKPANFMLRDEPHIGAKGLGLEKKPPGSWLRAIDFGCAQQVEDGVALTRKTGTPMFMAPEVFIGNYGMEADMWAAGMMMYQLLADRFPWWSTMEELNTTTLEAVMEAVIQKDIPMDYGPWKSLSKEGHQLINAMLQRTAENRISAEEALRHPWFAKHGVGVPERATNNIVPLGRKMSRKMSDTLRLRLSAAELSRAMSRPASGLSGLLDDMLDIHGESAGSNADLCATFA